MNKNQFVVLSALFEAKGLFSDLAFQFSARTQDVENMRLVLRAYGSTHTAEFAATAIDVARWQIREDGGNPDQI